MDQSNRLRLWKQVHPWHWAIAAVSLGLLFRIIHLDQDVFWVDEVATAIRISGYTRPEVTQQLATSGLLTIQDLQFFQQMGDRPWADTLYALTQSPEHAPLYFVLARLWVETVGNGFDYPISSLRSVSVVMSLVALPCFYGVCQELFGSPRISSLGVALFALSPYFVAYAQEARPYSLWTLLMLLTQALLLRSLRTQHRSAWISYGLALTLSLYTSLLTLLVVAGQVVYIGILWAWGNGSKRDVMRRSHTISEDISTNGVENYSVNRSVTSYGITTAIALLAFSPWVWIVVRHWQTLQDNTTWMNTPIHFWSMLAIWAYSLAILFFDVPVSVDPSLATVTKVITALGVLSLIGYATYWLCIRTPRSIRLFVLANTCSTPLILMGLDWMRSGQASATPRYLIPCQLGALIAVAYLLGDRLFRLDVSPDVRHRWRGITVLLVAISLLSCSIGVNRTPDYQKARNHANGAIATQVNRVNAPLLVAEPALTLDVLSLSHSLDADTHIQIVSSVESAFDWNPCQQTIFWLNPSVEAEAALPSTMELVQVYQPELLTPDDVHLALWQLKPNARCLE